MDHPAFFLTYPAVYAVRERYVITVPVTGESVMWVRVGGRCWYDDSNGILRSHSLTHRMEVPMAELDREREYTVCWRRVRERKPYFSDLAETEEASFSFRPVTGDPIRFYHIADAHNRVDSPVRAALNCGEPFDLLILNGDIPNHSGDIANFTAIHRIAGGITKGEIPVVFSRGNHDTRGIYAEELADHTPTDGGRSYYPVRLGPLWLLVLDCAEDKTDDHAEYGGTTCCHDFRLRETAFLEELADRPADRPSEEYAAEDVAHRLVVVHNPFSETHHPPFDIEQPLYTRWCEILKERIRPEAMICGHVHQCYVTLPGEELDAKGQPCPVICASLPGKDPDSFVGGLFTLNGKEFSVRFTDQDGNTVGSSTLPLA